MKIVRELFTKYNYIFLVVAFSLFASWPLFHAGLIPTHDGEYHLIRFYEFDKILREGNFYPRFAPDLNFSYGIPIFTYVYPLPNYVASLLHSVGISFLDSVKLNMALATILGGVFFYLWVKRFWGELGALVSAVFYTFSPYHFVDIYVRGSVGEVWALGIFPGFLWAYTKYVDTKNPLFAGVAGILLALVIFSHNILGLMFFAFAASYMIFFILTNKQKWFLLLSSFFILLLSLGLSAIFWIPALFETQFVTGLQVYNLTQNFPDIFQLLFPSWGTGFFGSNLGDEMSVQIGLANLLAITLGFITFLYFLRKREKIAYTLGYFLLWFVVLFFLILPVSLPIWHTIPLIHYFQFPWRLLSLVILVSSFLAGSVFAKRHALLIAIALILFAIGTTYTYTHPAYYMMRNDRYYSTRSNFIDSTNSPGNVFNTIWNQTKISRPKELFASNTNTTITNQKKISSTDFFTTLSATTLTREILTVSYFPGWYATLDNKPIPVVEHLGLVSVMVPSGTHLLHIFLGLTTIELVATDITGATISLLILFFLLRKKHN